MSGKTTETLRNINLIGEMGIIVRGDQAYAGSIKPRKQDYMLRSFNTMIGLIATYNNGNTNRYTF